MTKHAVSQEIIKLTKAAIESVGEEAFEENGPDEVMDLEQVTQKYLQLPLNQKIQVSQDLFAWKRCSETLCDVLMRIEHDLMMDDKEWDREEIMKIIESSHPLIKESFAQYYEDIEGI
jgi:hypothetical protein